LIASIPILGKIKDRLEVIPGSVPNLIGLPPGCKFAPRCLSRLEYELDICTEEEPELQLSSAGHKVRCWLYQDNHDNGFKAPLGDVVQKA
jgi:oligopeptide/dipeptide ABC transporter ATP-binding protein